MPFAPLSPTLFNKAKVIESFSFSVYSRILINKIDKIGLRLTMFVGYQKFKTAFPGLFNSFSIHSEAWVTAVFRQVTVSNSFHWYRLKNKELLRNKHNEILLEIASGVRQNTPNLKNLTSKIDFQSYITPKIINS